VTGTRNLQGKILLIAFKNCTVRHGSELIFTPDQGLYHIGIGKEVVSAFSGPADYNSFDLVEHELSVHDEQVVITDKQMRLEELYQLVRNIREGITTNTDLPKLHREITQDFGQEWLLLLELYELIKSKDQEASEELLSKLELLSDQANSTSELLDKGLKLIRA